MPNPLNRVVVHFLDGRILKGVTQDFYANRNTFHVAPIDKGPAAKVDARKLKAIFFVHEGEGDRRREDRPGFLGGPDETRHGGRVAVLFKDGELICGYSLGYKPEKEGFFLFPADREGNNTRIYVFAKAATEIASGSEAEELARRVLGARAA